MKNTDRLRIGTKINTSNVEIKNVPQIKNERIKLLSIV